MLVGFGFGVLEAGEVLLLLSTIASVASTVGTLVVRVATAGESLGLLSSLGEAITGGETTGLLLLSSLREPLRLLLLLSSLRKSSVKAVVSRLESASVIVTVHLENKGRETLSKLSKRNLLLM